MKLDIEKFRSYLWLVEALTTEAMTNLKKPLTKEHWVNILSLCEDEKNKFEVNEEFTLDQLLNCKLDEHRGKIEETSKEAEKQFNIEKKLKDLEEDMKELELEFMEFKNTKTYILKGVDEV